MQHHIPSQTYFHEEQRFRQWWMPPLILFILATTVGLMGWAFYQQLVLGEPFGDNPASDTALIAIGIPTILLGLGLTWLLLNARLVTEVRTDGVYYRYFPFIPSSRRIAFEDIESVEAVTYSPMGEYGGWGVRWSMAGRGMGLNVSGNRGVRFTLKNGTRKMLGSQTPEAFASAILQRLPQEHG